MSEEQPPVGAGEGGREEPLGSQEDERKTEFMTTETRVPHAGLEPPPQPADGRYHLRSVIGEGGMATVYEAYDATLERTVAVKVLRPDLAKDPELRARFLYEARILAQMAHPGVLPVFAAGGMPDQGAYYAMKKVQGRTLKELLEGPRRPPRPTPQQEAELLGIFERVCETVAYAHSRGIVHRDLKPRNVMVDDFGVVLVLDWGLSKKLDEDAHRQGILATQPGVVKGTPAYMSPEQAKGQPEEVDFRTDVFSLGVILYQVLTKRLPFRGKTHTQVLEEIRHRQPPHPRQVSRRVSRALSAVCMKALSKNPDERYSTARELAEDIRLYQDHLPVSAYTPGPVRRVANWAMRHAIAATALGTTLVLLLVFAGAMWLHLERKRLVDEITRQQQKDQIRESMLSVQRIVRLIRDLDQDIFDAQARRQRLDPKKAAERDQLDQRLHELRTVRLEITQRLGSAMTKLFLLLTAETGGDVRQVDPEVVAFVRDFSMRELRSLVKQNELYRAHLSLHLHLTRYRELIGWTDEQVAELREMQKQVEARLREKYGESFRPPDWDQTPLMGLLRRSRPVSGAKGNRR